MAPHSYIALALSSGPNRSAAAATLAIAVAVLALGRIPLTTGAEIDLRVTQHVDGWSQASLFGFGAPSEQGRRLEAAPARVVWNRPLPERFTLALDAMAEAPRGQVLVRVTLGDSEERVSLSRSGPTHIELENPLGLRELGLASEPAGARILLRRAAVRGPVGR